jgi:hypothetical protein
MTTRKDNVEYHNGRAAFAKGDWRADNPYLSSPEPHPNPDSRWSRWDAGYRDAYNEHISESACAGTQSDYLERTNNGTSFTGSDIDLYRAAVIACGLRMYARTGMRPNKAYTPTAMLREANRITGRVYKRGQYLAAADALTEWVERAKATPRT